MTVDEAFELSGNLDGLIHCELKEVAETLAAEVRRLQERVAFFQHKYSACEYISLEQRVEKAEQEVRRLRGGWQPIETAPKDWTWILAVNAETNKGRQHVVHYSERHGKKFPWVTDSAPMSFVAGITHWQPLPEPPNGR